MTHVRRGVIVLQTRPWTELEETFTTLEDLLVDVAYVADHLSHPTLAGRWLADGWTTLAAAAATTTTIGLGTLVASAAIRTPMALARAAATVDDISGGRMVLGLGAGSPHDVAVDGGSPRSARDMTDRFAEVAHSLDRIWAGEGTWQGRLTGFAESETRPLAPGRTRPFLMLAAHGPRGFDLVAATADGWSTYGGPQAMTLGGADTWAVLRRQSEQVTAACERLGRDPASLRRSVLLGYGLDRPLASVESYLGQLAAAEENGFDELVVYWPDGEEGTRFWADPDVVVEALAARS